jgi:oxygen-independent coproporphyrinogen-3 oxidase
MVWQKAYLSDLKTQAQRTQNRKVTSIFFGGGTPSLMDPKTVESILKTIQSLWPLEESIEITLEANPNSLERNKFQAFKTAGINRLSIGIQSLKESSLKFLGRAHSASEAWQALETAQKFFNNYSLDFIYAHPLHTPDAWHKELMEILHVAPPHLSLYQLTIEPQTPFEAQYRQGHFKMPSAITSEAFYDQTQECLTAHGYTPYEVSNFCKPGHASRHNLTYWRYQDYVGIGPGAHGRLTEKNVKYATRSHRAPEVWLEKIQKTGCALTHNTPLEQEACLQEALIMGVRLQEGLCLKNLGAYTPCQDFWMCVGVHKYKALVTENLIEKNSNYLRLTPKGRKKLNQILTYLLT